MQNTYLIGWNITVQKVETPNGPEWHLMLQEANPPSGKTFIFPMNEELKGMVVKMLTGGIIIASDTPTPPI